MNHFSKQKKNPGPVLLENMQTLPPSKRSVPIFLSKLLHNILKRMKHTFSDFCDFYFSKNFLYFFIRFYRPNMKEKIMSQKMRIVLKRVLCFEFFVRFLVSEIWSIFYSTFVVNWGLDEILQTWFRNANKWYLITSWLGGFNQAFQHVEILFKNLLTIYIVKEICEWNRR